MVSRDDEGWTATDMAQMAGMMSAFGGKSAAGIDDYTVKQKKAGRSETIAGYKGTAYVAEVRDGSGKVVSTDEIVYSKNKDIKRITKSLNIIMGKMGTMMMQGASGAMNKMIKNTD